MTSVLDTIYDQLEALAVTFTDKNGASVTPAVYSQETYLDQVQTAHIPARVLLPASGSMDIIDGGNVLASWQIADLCLLEAIAQGAGSREENPQMTRYMMAYAQKIGRLWQILSEWHTEGRTLNTQITSGKFEFPAGSSNWWYGVRCNLTITEII
jgi:hypothetical protein